MIAQRAISEIILRGYDQPRLIQRTEPGIRMLRRNAQSAVREGLLVTTQLLQVVGHGFRRRPKETP